MLVAFMLHVFVAFFSFLGTLYSLLSTLLTLLINSKYSVSCVLNGGTQCFYFVAHGKR